MNWMTILLYCFLYAGVLLFLGGCVVRAVRYAREPIHLRWEIHPVPHGRASELKVMIPEILFLKGLWEFNRAMWYVSFPFHFGLYLLVAAAALILFSIPAAGWAILHQAYAAAGVIGLWLALWGALGLLARRLATRELRTYTTAGDVLNLVFFAATFALLLAGHAWRPANSPGPLAILRGAATWDTALKPPALLTAGLMAGGALLAYIPMTHMSHFIAKYFTYHAVRWDARANVPGGTLEKRMAQHLMYRPAWAAPHVQAGGARTWAEIAATNPAQGGRK